MRKIAWLSVIGVLGFIYIASSIPGLRVLPVIEQFVALTSGMDLIFERLSNWIIHHLPSSGGFFAPIDAVFQDFLIYMRRNPDLVEFFLRKLVHILVFFTLTLILFFLSFQYISSKALALLVSFTGGLVFSILDEIRQSFVPGRFGSPFDVMINMIGVCFAIVFILLALVLTSGERSRFFEYRGLIENEKSSLT